MKKLNHFQIRINSICGMTIYTFVAALVNTIQHVSLWICFISQPSTYIVVFFILNIIAYAFKTPLGLSYTSLTTSDSSGKTAAVSLLTESLITALAIALKWTRI